MPEWSVTKTKLYINYILDKSSQLSYYTARIGIFELIFDRIKMSKKFLTKIEKNCFGKNLQAVIIYDIILDWLFLNYLQRIII